MTDIQNSKTLQCFKLRSLQRRIVVHLELVDFGTLAHVAENSFDGAVRGDESVAAVLANLFVGKCPEVDIYGSN